MQVTYIPSRIREVSTPGEVGLVQFRPLHSQNTTWTEGKSKRHLSCCFYPRAVTRMCHLEHCNWSSVPTLTPRLADPHTHTPVYSPPTPKGSSKSVERMRPVLPLKPPKAPPHSVGIKTKLLNLVHKGLASSGPCPPFLLPARVSSLWPLRSLLPPPAVVLLHRRQLRCHLRQEALPACPPCSAATAPSGCV